MENFLYMGLLFCFGDYIGFYWRSFLSLEFALLFFGLTSVFTFYFYKKNTNLKVYIFCAAIFIFLCGLVIGIGGAREGKNTLEKYHEQNVTLSGTIVPGTVKKLSNETINLCLDCDIVETGSSRTSTRGIVRLSIYNVSQNNKIVMQGYGSLQVQGKLKPIRGFANPGGFDTELAAKIQDVGGRMAVSSEKVRYLATAKPWCSYLTDIGAAMRKQLYGVMPDKDAAILAGMVLGGYDGIDADTVRNFSTTGIVHILSVSGSHVVLLIGFVLALMEALKVRKHVSLLLAAASIIGYSSICGFSPPVVRSALMGMAMLLGFYLQRNEDRGAILAIVSIVMLCYKPMWIFDVGFELSFASTAGLIYLFPPIKLWLSRYVQKYFADALGVTIAAQVSVLPLLVHYFHQVSLSALAANLIVVPIVEFIVLLTMAGLFLCFVVKPLGIILLLFASLLLSPVLAMTDWIASWPFAAVNIARTPFSTAIIYYLLLMCLFRFWPMADMPNGERKIIIVLACFSMLVPPLFTYFLRQPFTVYFIDVGQGDAALVITPDKKTIMVDTGGLRGEYNTGERIIVPFLRYLGINKLDVLALSHGHHDHAGGAAAIARSVPIDCVLLAREEPSEDVSALLNIVKNKSEIIQLSSGQQYRLGTCQINIIEAPQNSSSEGNSNESSAIMKLTVADKSIVFTGDATAEGEAAAASYDIKADVLKVSHHGSKNSSTREFLYAVQPKLAVISVGADNKFGHPAPETLEKLKETGARVLRTDKMGNVKVVFDGSNYTWYSYRYQKKYF